VGEFQVVNNILNTPITLKVGEVLATSKDLVDQLAFMIKLKNIKPLSSFPQALLSARDTALLIKLPLECDGRQVSAILDTGSQLNIVSKNVSEKIIRCPVNSHFSATMKDANGGAGRLAGRIDNVPLRCGGVLTNATLFVGEQLLFDLLLERPWQRNNLVSIEERVNGTYVVFRNREKPNLTCELLVEEQIPKPFYLLDNSWPEELVDDEFWPTELIDRNEVNVALMTLDEPTENTEETTSTTRDTTQTRPSQHLAAVKSEFENDAKSGNLGLGQDWPDFIVSQSQIQTHKSYFKRFIPNWDTMGKVISKYTTKGGTSPNSITIRNLKSRSATKDNPIPSGRTIAIDKPIFNDSPTDNPISSGRTIAIDKPIFNDSPIDNPNSSWRTITTDNPISNDTTKDNTSSSWRTMEDRDKLRLSIDPQKWKWHDWTAYKQAAISKYWNKNFHLLTPASVTAMATPSSDSLSFLQELPLSYTPNSVPPPESIASHDPFMGRADQYRHIVSLQHLLDLAQYNRGLNSAIEIITLPQAIRYGTQQFSCNGPLWVGRWGKRGILLCCEFCMI
jgi:hypothetical protein